MNCRVSTTFYATRPASHSVYTFVTLIVLSLFQTVQAAQNDSVVNHPTIAISYMRGYPQENELRLNASMDFRLKPEVIDAIEHDIPITFTTEIILYEQTSFIGMPIDRKRKTIRYQTTLLTYGVDRHYLLYNNRNNKRQRFSSIENALQTLGTLHDFSIIALTELHPQQPYRLKMRMSLDHWSLPAPLILTSLLEEAWKMDSGWFEVDIHTPKSWM